MSHEPLPTQETSATGPRVIAPGPIITRYIGYVIALVFVLFCGQYLWRHHDEFMILAEKSKPDLIGAGLMILVSMFIAAYQLGLFFRHFGVVTGKLELAAITFGVFLGNNFLPMRGGSAGLAVYMKKVHGLEFSSFAAIYGGTGLLAILVNSALALMGFIYMAIFKGYFNPGLLIIIALMFFISLLMCLAAPNIKWKHGKALGFVLSAIDSWRVLAGNRGLLLLLTLSFVGISCCMAVAFLFIYRATGVHIGLWASLIISSLGNIANAVPISPGSLGIFDTVTIQIPRVFGLEASDTIVATLVFRILWLGWGIALGLPGLFYMSRRVARDEKINKKTYTDHDIAK